MNLPIKEECPVKGSVVTPEELDLMLDDYYTSRGWTLKGVPTKQKLQQLGLEEFENITKED
jgi:aldehyde:ferredoxin oxidoreductase